MKKKLLFISNISFGGLGSFSKASFLAAKELGWEFHTAANFNQSTIEQQKADEKKYGIQIHHINFVRNPLHPANIKAYKELITLLKKENFDVIHCNTPVGGVYGRLAAKKCGVKNVIYQAHGFHFYKNAPKKNWFIYYPIERFLAKFTDALVTINQEDYEKAQTFNIRSKGQTYYVPGVGIDLSVYADVINKRVEIKNELGLKASDTVLISMGDLIPRKNYNTAIEAIAECNDPNIHYLICGQGPELEKLQKLASERMVSEQVHFLGHRTDVKELLKSSDIFLFTTLQEGMPRSMMEAMASGLPYIASKIRGNVDLLEDGKGGYLVGIEDSKEIAKKINYLANRNELREQMGNANLEQIQKFDVKEVKKIIEKIYLEVVKP